MREFILFLADLWGVPLQEKVPVMYKKGFCMDCGVDRMVTVDNVCAVCKSKSVDVQTYRIPPCVVKDKADREKSAARHRTEVM